MASDELKEAAKDLCRWAIEEGVPMFVLFVEDSGAVTYAGPLLPGDVVGKMLRTAATGCEKQMGAQTLQ